MEAAEQVHAIAPGLVSEYIAQLTGVECNHVIRRRRTRDADCRPRADRDPLPTRNSARARHEALEYLASALAAPSLKDDPRVAGIVRESTDQGKTVVSFLLHVMHGVVRGFRPRQRVDAANELLGHIARDELARSGSLPAQPVEAPAPSAAESSFPSSREPIPGTTTADGGPARASVIPAKAGIQTAPEHGRQPADPSSPTAEPPDEADLTVIPAEAGIQDGGDEDEADDQESPDPERGCYDIDRKITEARRDQTHPIHKFVQAYDEVAAAFHGEDKKNDDDEEVRYWISGEVPDAYGKYIWEYAPANPRSIRRKLRPRRRRRSREPGTAPKGESIWMPRPSDKMREEGIKPPKRTLIWV